MFSVAFSIARTITPCDGRTDSKRLTRVVSPWSDTNQKRNALGDKGTFAVSRSVEANEPSPLEILLTTVRANYTRVGFVWSISDGAKVKRRKGKKEKTKNVDFSTPFSVYFFRPTRTRF